MKKSEKISSLIAANKELSKKIESNCYYSVDQFISDANRYIKAIEQGRMFCIIDSVSKSGMSRVLRFVEWSKGQKNYNFMNFYAFFGALGFIESGDGFRISGCGMDMVFHTNYSIIHKLHKLGFIDMKKRDVLAQRTPTTF